MGRYNQLAALVRLGALATEKEQPPQPINETIYLWNIGIEEVGGDGRPERPSRLFLPSKPSVDDRLWFV